MTETTTNPLARPAESFHWLVSGIIWHAKAANLFAGTSAISERGQTVTITAEMLDASPWIARYLGNDEAQIARWGEVRIAPGAFPSDVLRWTPGSVEHAEAREGARRRAWAILDPAERAAAREAVERDYGPAAPTSRTLSAPTSSPEQRAANEQRRRLDAGGVHAVSNNAPGRRA